MKVKFLLAFLLISFIANQSYIQSQTLNYQEIFGEDWKNAEEFLRINEPWIKVSLEKYNINYQEAISIIFPELVRYSALLDKMEITLLKALYINLGKKYANFSIGRFQMKPSFAEQIRKEAPGIMGRRSHKLVRDSVDFENERSFRASVVDDLEDTRTELNYLILFIKICEKRFELRKMTTDERIKFLATAYNYGFFNSLDDIEKMTEKKFFNTKIISSDKYSYADISLYWYCNNLPAR
jgi:hypothetical protein